jgi:LacI family transcriptional regulator, gluconate utilization system Gnt-I transcriptional repressor
MHHRMAETKSRKRAQAAPASGPTLEDVSRLARVSSATVSRVLNNPEMVAEATRERVFVAIRDTGYVPNLLAGGLASNRSRLVAAFVPGIAASIFNETIEAMTRELAAAGYLVVLGLMSDQPEEMDRTITSILSRRPDALILTSAESSTQIRKRLKAAEVTVIETWDLPPRPIDLAIGFSHEAVGRALARLVAEKGRRSPLIITADSRRALARMQGFLKEAQELGLEPVRCDVSAHSTSGAINGAERFSKALADGARPDVVVCGSDAIAQGVLGEALARRLSVPGDVGVVGFGGSELGAFTRPPLTTVRIDGHAIGRQAAQVLVGRAKGIEPPRRRIDVGFEIVLRQSL